MTVRNNVTILHDKKNGVAREMIYATERIKVDEVLRLGLVNKVVPIKQAYDSALETARKIASMSSYTLRMAKKALTLITETGDMDTALWCERGAAFISSTGEGFEEGMRVFLEKRPPQFKQIDPSFGPLKME